MKIKVLFPKGTPERQKMLFYGRFADFGYEFEESPDADYLVATTFIYLSPEALSDFYAKAPYYVTILDLFAEAFVPDFNWVDYAIGMDRMSFGNRMIRLPLRMDEFVDLNQCRNGVDAEREFANKKHFCNFIYRNANAHPSRDALFHALCRYKMVHSLGDHLNNYKGDGLFCGDGNGESWLTSSIRMKSDYKFTISFENALYPGYVSEKLLTTFMANSVPIYWGNPDIADEYNPEAFVNCHSFANISEVVDYVRYLDNTPEAYTAMLQAPPRTPEQDACFRAELAKAREQLKAIFASPKKACEIKSDGFWVNKYRSATSAAQLNVRPARIPEQKIPKQQISFLSQPDKQPTKYAKLFYQYRYAMTQTEGDGGWGGACNLGDNVQTLAVLNLYQHLSNSPKAEDVVPLNRDDLQEYDGEEVILPMQGWFGMAAGEFKWPPSSQIKPVFVGFHLTTCNNSRNQLEEQDGVEYLKSHGPIGCRDLSTRDYLRKNGVDAYFSGCNTLTLPKREKEPENGKIYLVDVLPSWKRNIPEEIMNDAEEVSHICFLKNYPVQREEALSLESDALELLKMYRDNAKLVITSRIHCAMPCLAMGIPVVFLCWKADDERFSVLQHFVHTYTLKEKNLVDWSPQAVEFEQLKHAMISNAVKRMEALQMGTALSPAESKQLIEDIQTQFANVKEKYVAPIRKQLVAAATANTPSPAKQSVKNKKSQHEVLLEEAENDSHLIRLRGKVQYKALRRLYNRCKLMALLTSGKKNEHYVRKMARIKALLRSMKK